jgi:hypothetical protein
MHSDREWLQRAMDTMHSTLLVGPADWNPAALPREEFAARLAALWRAEPDVHGAIVYGNPRHHAELAWLTHFTPKLEASLAFIPRSGEPMLMVGGGPNMIGAAKPLTFVEKLQPLRNAGAAAASWVQEIGARRILLVGADAMPPQLRQAIADTLLPVALEDAGRQVRALLRRKSQCERALMRDACAILDGAVAALGNAARAGVGASDAVLAAEHAAYRRQAQDVRTLFSLDQGRTLRPFELPVAQHVDPFQVYLAVRFAGYWAEGFCMLSARPPAALDVARAALRSALPLVKAGARRGDIADALAERGGASHPVASVSALSLGLSLDDPDDQDETLLEGEVLSLRAGVLGDGAAAIASAIVAVQSLDNTVLWQTP